MNGIGFETSGAVASVAAMKQGDVAGEIALNLHRSLNENIIEITEFLLGKTQIERDSLDFIAISIGPGSFTGLRIGLGIAKGMSFLNGIPLIPVPTLDVLAWDSSFTEFPVFPVIEARKNEIYTAEYRFNSVNRLERKSDYRVIDPEKFSAEFNVDEQRVNFVGGDASKYRKILENQKRVICSSPFFPKASTLLNIAKSIFEAGDFKVSDMLEPFYIMPSSAELKKRSTRGNE
jgi:tRNA threonylcarbamoyladenosine biosynthesis protein TsaB